MGVGQGIGSKFKHGLSCTRDILISFLTERVDGTHKIHHCFVGDIMASI